MPRPLCLANFGSFFGTARWDDAAGCLSEPLPGVMFSELPPVHFRPVQVPEADALRTPRAAPGRYACPLYKTQARSGALSTTGQSTNFVLHLALPIPSGTQPEQWALQGVAALCSLID